MNSTTQDTVKVPQPQFRLHDHLGNTVVYFHDKNNDGCITTEADTNDPDSLEVIQRFWYYPFGMAMQGLRDWATEPGQWYRYNGKERDTVSGWYDYGARWYIDEIGRFAGVDPIADQMPGWSPYSYGFDNPVMFIDPTGLAPESSFGVNDKIDIDQKSGKIKITAAAGDDVVRIMNDSKEVSSYTYGKNGSFRAENTLENRTFGKNAIPGQVIVSSNATKALGFFKFAAKSNVEFGLLEVKKGESVLSVISTTHESTRLSSSGFLVNEYSKKGYSGIDHWHSHPDGNAVPSGYFPEVKNNPASLMPVPVGSKSDIGDARHARGIRQKEGFHRTQFFIYTPALKTITRYDGYTKATIQKDN